jgi:hypothetical protein
MMVASYPSNPPQILYGAGQAVVAQYTDPASMSGAQQVYPGIESLHAPSADGLGVQTVNVKAMTTSMLFGAKLKAIAPSA